MKTTSKSKPQKNQSLLEKTKDLNKSNISSISAKENSKVQKKITEKKSHKSIDTENIKLPKNINEYRHIIDTFQSRDSEVEWIFELRGYSKKKEYLSLKNTTINEPHFYNEDYQKYKKKVEEGIKDKSTNSLRLKGNTRDFEHLLKKRLQIPANPTQIGFDSTLREFTQFKTVHGPPNSNWKNLNISSKKNLLNTLLPPVTGNSIKNITHLNKYVSRPYVPVIDESLINDSHQRRRKFEMTNLCTSRFGGEHNAALPYSYKYPEKNLNSIRHLMNDGNLNSLSIWESGLRGYKKQESKKDKEK